MFHVARRTVFRWKLKLATTGSLSRRYKGKKPKLSEAQRNLIKTWLQDRPTLTNEQISAKLHGAIAPRTVSLYCKRLNITRKKITDEPASVFTERVLQETKEYLQTIAAVPEEHRVYMDESFVYDNEAPAYGRAPAGERIH
jgi:transposase